jgi:hypothetical protein
MIFVCREEIYELYLNLCKSLHLNLCKLGQFRKFLFIFGQIESRISEKFRQSCK